MLFQCRLGQDQTAAIYILGWTQPTGVGGPGAGGSGKDDLSVLGTCTAVGGTEGLGDMGARGRALRGSGLRGHPGAVWGLLSRDFIWVLAPRHP